MKLIFLGTGPAIVIPRHGHTDPTCREARRAGSHSRRLRSSLLIEHEGKAIMIDTSPDVLTQLDRVGRAQVDAAFLTHAHSDAVGGLNDLMLLHEQTKQKPLKVFSEINVLIRARQALEPLHRHPNNLPKRITFRSLKDDAVRRIGPFEVAPFPVIHSLTPGFPTLGFRVNDEVVYASDVARIPKNSERFIRGIPHLILDGCMWFGTQIASHLTVNESIAIALRLKVGHLYLTQISHNYPPHDKAVRAIRVYLRKQKITLPVTLAYDKLRVKI